MNVSQNQPIQSAHAAVADASLVHQLYRLLPISMLMLYGVWWLLRPQRLAALLALPRNQYIFAGILIVSALILFLPPPVVRRWYHDGRARFQKDVPILGLLLLVAGGLRLLYGNDEPWSLDQTGLIAAARVLAEQGLTVFFTNYGEFAWLGFQHPPLAALYFGGAMGLFGTSALTYYVAAFLVTAALLVATYYVGKLLYTRWVGLAAALLLIFISAFMEHNVNMSNDMLLVLCFVLAIRGTLLLLRAVTFGNLVLTGLAIGAGLLSKYTMLFFYPWLLAMGLLTQPLWTPTMAGVSYKLFGRLPILRSALVRVAMVGGLGLLLFVPWIAYNLQNGALTIHVKTVAHYAGIEAAEDGRARITLTNDWHNEQRIEALLVRWPSRLGFHNLPLMGLGLLAFWRNRRRVDWIVLLWIGAVVGPVFLLLPIWRYIAPAFPALALLMARGLTEVPTTVQLRALAMSALCTTTMIYFGF